MFKIIGLLLIGLLSGCVTLPWQTASIVPEKVAQGIYRGPRPVFEELNKLNIKVDLSLEDNVQILVKERAEAKTNNVVFINHPLSESTSPSVNDLQNIANIINENRSQNIYVHCRRGIDRTGYAIASWRMLYDGWTYNNSYKEILDHGHSSLYFYSWKSSLKNLKGN